MIYYDIFRYNYQLCKKVLKIKIIKYNLYIDTLIKFRMHTLHIFYKYVYLYL